MATHARAMPGEALAARPRTRYTPAASALSAWLLQMLLVAFSRRMCCSRVEQREHERRSCRRRRPSGRRGGRASGARASRGRRRSRGPGRRSSSALPSGWPSPTTMSAPYALGGSSTPSRIGLAATTNSAPASCASVAERREVLEHAEEVRAGDEHRARRRRSSRAASVCEVDDARRRRGDVDDLERARRRRRCEHLEPLGMHAAARTSTVWRFVTRARHERRLDERGRAVVHGRVARRPCR